MRIITPIAEHYQNMDELAQAQCAALFDQLNGTDDEDFDPSDEPQVLQGISRDNKGRAYLVFASDYRPREHQLIYVDAILNLADLLRRERVLPSPDQAP